MWPRSDLHSWVKVLNRFDDILKSVIDEYELDKLQLNPFSAQTKLLVTEILGFETLLLDNSTNRKLFASYDVRFQHLIKTLTRFLQLFRIVAHQLTSFCRGHRYNRSRSRAPVTSFAAVLIPAIYCAHPEYLECSSRRVGLAVGGHASTRIRNWSRVSRFTRS
jgi:hypothetical protein